MVTFCNWWILILASTAIKAGGVRLSEMIFRAFLHIASVVPDKLGRMIYVHKLDLRGEQCKATWWHSA
jgi:hypothetical protein